jgi:hypothetical protein
MSKEVQKQVTGLGQLQDQFDQAQYLIDNKLVPNQFKTPQQIVAAISIGSSIDMDPITSLNSIDLIQGNHAIKSKMIPGLLARKGIAIKVLKDYEPITKKVPTVIKGEDGKPLLDAEGNMKYYKDPNGEVIYKDVEIDRITEVEFTRVFPGIGPVTNVISFKLSYAEDAEWYPNKPNWKKMPSYMMMARCITKGARIVASDVLAGLYDDYETAEFTNASFDIDDEGHLIIED